MSFNHCSDCGRFVAIDTRAVLNGNITAQNGYVAAAVQVYVYCFPKGHYMRVGDVHLDLDLGLAHRGHKTEVVAVGSPELLSRRDSHGVLYGARVHVLCSCECRPQRFSRDLCGWAYAADFC